MGLHNRPYMRDDFNSGGGRSLGSVFGGMPRPKQAVKWLLIANVAVFFLQQILLGLTSATAVIPSAWWQVWRYLTFQFLHGGPIHLLFNMIGLYFLGMILENAWGSKRFLKFYLVCGAVAGLTHVAITFAFNPSGMNVRLVGASGGVYAIVLACAVFFPRIQVIVLFFPMPIRFAAMLFIGIAGYNILSGGFNSGISDAAHLGGAGAAAVWIWILPKLKAGAVRRKSVDNRGAWQRKMQKLADEQAQIDSILAKIHENGIASLTGREKKILRDATRRQQTEDRGINRL